MAKSKGVEEAQERDLLIRIEHYIDPDPEAPAAFEQFARRISTIHHELDRWETLVIDSVTYMEIAARYHSLFRINKNNGDGRAHFGYSTDRLEQILMVRFGSLLTNVVVNCHVNEEKDEMHGNMVRNPAAPGRMSKRFSSGYSEFYRAFRKEDGPESYYALQTRQSGLWNAASQIDAPDPCYPDYEELWVNWDGPRIPLHVLNYGDSGGGKSTFTATFPKPMLVFAFDPLNKELPYLKKGESEIREENGILVHEVFAPSLAAVSA